ncbi:type II toxin-antitoxin system RelE/ParE family toxin [Prosthecobacter dejongeii]|uniref:Plasmid stabilization system protein ParE n=1 Tax=Prosthecobacter dejongeii TaxID=48465 RepID=A0A7W7YHK6_9BACT|nr:type II toxin-antitoxin system RelE/ParE family toxin [Prosthecobacter dejongeii]MBB5036313.1 plasmid stabilization system protein ParE [Prosthecobacter dejongeii]
MKLIILSSAERDLEDGWHFYEDQEPGTGDIFLQSTLTGIRGLSDSYGIHPHQGRFYRMLLKKFHRGIYYTVESDRLLIHRVIDLRQDPQWIRRELKRSL